MKIHFALLRSVLLLLSLLLLSCTGASEGGAGDSGVDGGGSPPIPTYSVIYHGNGNTGGAAPIDPVAYEAGQTVSVLGNTGDLTNTGASFNGWNTQADAKGKTYTVGQTFVMGSSDVDLYAMWTTLPTYTVTYEGNGNTGGSVPLDTTKYKQGQSVTVLGNTKGLARTGYTFSEWNTLSNGSGTSYAPGHAFAIGSTDVTLYAQWAAIPTYAVIYHANGAATGSVPVDATAYLQGDSVTVLGNTGNLAVTGFAFTGWNTVANGTGTTYAGGQTFAMGSANVDLYALWKVAYTVTYNGNGSTSGTPPVDAKKYLTGDTVTVLANTGKLHVNGGYGFTSWNTNAIGTGTTYTAGQTFVMGSANVVLYAIWVAGKTVFVTSAKFTGSLASGGLTGVQWADSYCNNVAASADSNIIPAGTYKAWLSDDSSSPSTRFTFWNMPYIRPDGQIFSYSMYTLTLYDEILNPLTQDEHGNEWPGVLVWTDTNFAGTEVTSAANAGDCANWTVSTFANEGGYGLTSTTAADWTNRNREGCGDTNHFYCFQQ